MQPEQLASEKQEGTKAPLSGMRCISSRVVCCCFQSECFFSVFSFKAEQQRTKCVNVLAGDSSFDAAADRVRSSSLIDEKHDLGPESDTSSGPTSNQLSQSTTSFYPVTEGNVPCNESRLSFKNLTTVVTTVNDDHCSLSLSQSLSSYGAAAVVAEQGSCARDDVSTCRLGNGVSCIVETSKSVVLSAGCVQEKKVTTLSGSSGYDSPLCSALETSGGVPHTAQAPTSKTTEPALSEPEQMLDSGALRLHEAQTERTPDYLQVGLFYR